MRAAAALLMLSVLATPATGQAPSARLEAMRRPFEAVPSARTDAAAEAVGFVAALFAHDCGYVAGKVAFPAVMGGNVAFGVDDVIPRDACDAWAADADPLQVLADQELVTQSFEIDGYGHWSAAHPSSVLASISPAPDDVVVTVAFGRRGRVEKAVVLLGGRPGGARIRGYLE